MVHPLRLVNLKYISHLLFFSSLSLFLPRLSPSPLSSNFMFRSGTSRVQTAIQAVINILPPPLFHFTFGTNNKSSIFHHLHLPPSSILLLSPSQPLPTSPAPLTLEYACNQPVSYPSLLGIASTNLSSLPLLLPPSYFIALPSLSPAPPSPLSLPSLSPSLSRVCFSFPNIVSFLYHFYT